MKKKFLILIDSNKIGFFPDKTGNAIVCEIYKSNSILSRIARKIFLLLRIPFRFIYFTDWYKQKNSPDVVILFDTGNAKYIIPCIHKVYPKARIILWFWNSVAKTINPHEIKNKNIEMWSFDLDDCKHYGMRYNTQFFSNYILKDMSKDIKPEFDLFFIGTDKGRIKQLTELKKIADMYKLTYDFHVVGDETKKILGWNCNYRTGINYRSVIEKNLKSKAIVDIVAPGQHGLTLRPIEAMFLKRKLITNFSGIKEFDFYNKNNIFILGVDEDCDLPSFLCKPYSSDFDVEYYEMNSWIQRFVETISDN